jgi:hypothetical protein
MRYEFKNASGAWCCRANDKTLLCAACKAQLNTTELLRDAQGIPSPYESAMQVAPVNLGPNYQPYGEPPNSYALALERQAAITTKPTPKESV